MKINLKYFRIVVSFFLLLISLNQGVWIYNMYLSYKYDFEQTLNKSLQEAMLKEVAYRKEKTGFRLIYSGSSQTEDTTRYVKKQVRAKDTAYTIEYDRYDPYADLRVFQYVVKDILPINVNMLDSLFRQNLAKENYGVKDIYIECLDLENNEILSSNKKNNISTSSFVSSNVISVDIYDSLGVKAYVENPLVTILNRMIFQLILSVLLIVVSVICLFYLLQTIVFQWKEEKMRQTAINAMTHEFKRPISSAVAQISLIPYYLEKNDITRVLDYSNNTILELKKLTVYTERIQNIGNSNSNSSSLDRTDIEIKPFFESIRKKYTANMKVDINLDIQTEHNFMYIDLLHFSNVMDNLVENAIKYSKDAVEIEISVLDVKHQLQIRVKDNGIGISKIEKKYIFDKYYRSKDRTVRTKNGFGLGLTYVRSIVEAHQGTIYVLSELGKGSEFVINISNRQQ